MEKNEKRSRWYLTKRLSIIFVILFILDFVLLLLFGQPYKGGFSFGKGAFDTLTILLIPYLVVLVIVALYENFSSWERKNKENENST